MKDKLQTVILYDGEKNQYTVAKHNLTPDDASLEVSATSDSASSKALAWDQKTRHRTENPQDCGACRGDVRRQSSLNPTPKFKRRK